MSENLLDELSDDIKPNKSPKKKIIIILSSIVAVVVIIIVAIVLVIKLRRKGDLNLEHDISTVNFPSDIIYMGSHYNYDGNLFLIYKRPSSENFFFGIANDEGKLLKEIFELKNTTGMDLTYIHRASSFSDGKKVLVAGKILECSKKLEECDDAKLYDLVFPEELKNIKNLWYTFTEPIINYGGQHIFWSTFDTDLNILNFVGEIVKRNDKYYIENAVGLTNYFYDLLDKKKGTYSLPKILRFGPIKQVINGGKALSIGGFLNYGLRKGIYQSLSNDELKQLTMFEGYDETTAISPDSKLACVMTTRFSPSTSLEIVGIIPTPYSILASYLFSIHLLKFSLFKLRTDKFRKGNIGPALVDLEKVNKNKEYTGYNLTTDNNWNFNGFISWSPDGKKIMFDEISKMEDGKQKRRCQIVTLKKYKPGVIEMENKFHGNVPYNRTIKETINLHLDYPINAKVNGTTGDLEINRTEFKCEVKYNNYSEDNKIFYNGVYIYEKVEAQNYAVFEVNITSTGEKKGYCDYRLWLDLNDFLFLYEKAEDGKNKTYGKCDYEGKTISVDNYKIEL